MSIIMEILCIIFAVIWFLYNYKRGCFDRGNLFHSATFTLSSLKDAAYISADKSNNVLRMWLD